MAHATTRGTRTLLVLALATAGLGPVAKACPNQENPASDLAELQQRLTALREQLATETTAREQAAARHEQRRTGLQERRQALAQEVLEQELRRRQLVAERRQLGADRSRTASAAAELERALDGLQQTALEASEQLVQLLREIPGEAGTLAALEPFEDALRLGPAPANGHGAASAVLWETLDVLHQRGTEVALRRVELWTAQGRRESVDLLAAGLISFAYRTADGERLALALSSPAEASGYRWSEDLSPELKAALRATFDAGATGSAPYADVPVDVTGQVPASSVAAREGILQRLRSGGRVMVPLALVALVALGLILERIAVLFARNRTARSLTESVLAAARAGRYAEAEDACRSGRGAVAAVLDACLRRRIQGPQAMEDSIQEQLLHEAPRLQRFLAGLGILAAVAPLLGLLGTVTGIIRTFGVIRLFGNTNPSLMAGGISEALVTTAAGLSIAIPILLVLGFLRGRVDRILAFAEESAARLLNALVHDRPAQDGDAP